MIAYVRQTNDMCWGKLDTTKRDPDETSLDARLHFKDSLMRFSSSASFLCCAKIIDSSNGTSFTGEARSPASAA